MRPFSMLTRIGLALVASSVVALLAIYNFFPGIALGGMYAAYQWRSGVKAGEVTLADGYRLPYLRGGKGPAVVLVHGFGDSQISFVQSAAQLTSRFDVVLPTVPGFGSTAQDPKRDYSIRAQVASLRELFTRLGLTASGFHLVGNSMGGHISAAYALQFPEEVKSLVLLDAAGLRVDDPLPYKPMLAPLRSDADFEKRLDDTFVKKPWVPAPFRKRFIAESQRSFAWQNHLRAQIRGGQDYILNERVGAIIAPTLIVWGRQDTIVRVVHAPEWHKRLPKSRLLILEQMGHAPQYEDPARVGLIIRDFVLEQETAGRKAQQDTHVKQKE